MATNDFVYGHRGVIYKQQYNARIFQPIGSQRRLHLDRRPLQPEPQQFLRLAAAAHRPHASRRPTRRAARRRLGRRQPLPAHPRTSATIRSRAASPTRCAPGTGASSDAANTCGQEFEERYNPSNTGNIRFNSRFTLMDGLVLTVDPSFQYVKANGGGTVVAPGRPARRQPGRRHRHADTSASAAGRRPISCQIGYIGGTPYFGRDLNGDGDRLDTVRVLAPSQTADPPLRRDRRPALRHQRRPHASASTTPSIAAATARPARPASCSSMASRSTSSRSTTRSSTAQRQHPPEARPPLDRPAPPDFRRVSRRVLRQPADRQHRRARAVLHPRPDQQLRDVERQRLRRVLRHQRGRPGGLSGEQPDASNIGGGVARSRRQGPQHRVFHYNEVLPNVGLIYDIAPRASIFANYSRGLQVPEHRPPLQQLLLSRRARRRRSRSRRRPTISTSASATGRARIMAQALALVHDLPEPAGPAYRSGSRPERVPQPRHGRQIRHRRQHRLAGDPAAAALCLRLVLWSNIRDNVLAGECTATVSASCPAGSAGTADLRADRGQPRIGRAGLHASAAASRAARPGRDRRPGQADRSALRQRHESADQPVHQCTGGASSSTSSIARRTRRTPLFQVYGAKAPAYTIVDLDVRRAARLGRPQRRHLSSSSTSPTCSTSSMSAISAAQLLNTSVPFVQIGAPRAFIGTLDVAFR